MKIGSYETLRLLGKGGMSEVYEVTDANLGLRHALKFFTYEKDDPEVRERFLVEGKLLSRLNHPRIVRVTDLGVDGPSGRPYFVMDLVLNERGVLQLLSDVEPGTVDEETVGRWYDDLREGLAYIHANGVIHRDLKLQNVLIGPDGHAVLTDFGISKIFDAKRDGVQIVDTVKTLVKVREGRSLVMGSLGYMAPELEMGVAASPQSDWYALGVIVYRLLTGSWCDSRTDVVGMLETYDPAWKRILPKLLHSNPNGRECLSFAAERRADLERAECEAENRWLREKGRGHLARHVARWLAVALVLVLGVFAVVVVKYRVERRLWRVENALSSSQRSPYAFDELFDIPAAAREDAQTDDRGTLLVPSRENLAATRIDLLVITHDLLGKLASGVVTPETAIGELERLQGQFADDAETAFDRWPDSYVQCGDDETTYWMLGRAVSRLQELAER